MQKRSEDFCLRIVDCRLLLIERSECDDDVAQSISDDDDDVAD